MATYQNVGTVSLIAGTAIEPYRFVAVASDGEVDHVGTADARADAVSCEKQATAGQPVACQPVAGGAIVKVEAGAAVTRGGLVGSDNAGKAKNAGTAVDNWRMGVALDTASADGDVIRVLLIGASQDAGT